MDIMIWMDIYYCRYCHKKNNYFRSHKNYFNITASSFSFYNSRPEARPRTIIHVRAIDKRSVKGKSVCFRFSQSINKARRQIRWADNFVNERYVSQISISARYQKIGVCFRK